MKQYRLCFLGFGNVGRALARLVLAKATELRDTYGIECQITGVASRRLGWLVCEEGFDVPTLLAKRESVIDSVHSTSDLSQWLTTSRPDIVFETTSLNPHTGQPAIDYLRAALEAGAHAITANKGPIVYGYDQLRDLARAQGKRFLFESTVLDSAPVFSLFRESLPLAKLRGFSGVFNSTTNVILETMEEGRSFAEGVKTAQELGVAETDPSYDVDGWDSTMKICAVARVVMQMPLLPGQIERQGIRELTAQQLQKARGEGRPIKLVSRARFNEVGTIVASVKPEQVPITDPLGSVRGTSLGIHFELDMIPGLTVISHRPNLQSTAYGLFADFVNAVR